MKHKKAVIVVASVLGTLLVVLVAVAVYYVVVARRTVDKVTTPEGDTIVLAVYVLQEDPAQRIEDTKDYPYGVNRLPSDEDSMQRMTQDLQEILGKAPDITEYENQFSLMDSLQNQDVRAVILNEAYVGSLAEVEGYKWVESGIRRIESYEFEQAPPQSQTPQQEESNPSGKAPDAFVLYISGIDTYGGITARSRSDVNILAVVNMDAGTILMVSTPRDYYVDFSVTGGQKDKLTHAGIYGVEASMDALQRLYDVQIDYYLKVNFTGFVDIIDALGGIEVYSEYDFTVENIRDYQKGYNQVSGIEALAFARERYSFASGDYQRGKNQMEVIRAVIQKCTSTAVLKNFRQIMDGIAGSFESNMPSSQVYSLVSRQLNRGTQWQITTYSVEGANSYQPTFSMPGRDLFVILPDSASVNQAKSKIQAALAA